MQQLKLEARMAPQFHPIILSVISQNVIFPELLESKQDLGLLSPGLGLGIQLYVPDESVDLKN